MLDDLLGSLTQGHREHGHPHHGLSEHGYKREHHDKHLHAGIVLGVLRSIVRNKVLLAGLIASGVLVLALGVWVLVTLLSFSGPLFDFVGKNGVKGVVETGLGLAQKLWEGAGK